MWIQKPLYPLNALGKSREKNHTTVLIRHLVKMCNAFNFHVLII